MVAPAIVSGRTATLRDPTAYRTSRGDARRRQYPCQWTVLGARLVGPKGRGCRTTVRVVMVVVFSLGAACCYALASILQQSAAADVPAEHSMRLGLLTRLVRRPLWLVGVVTDFAGFGFEA